MTTNNQYAAMADELMDLVETAAEEWTGCDWETACGAGEISADSIDAGALREAATGYRDWETDDDVPPSLRDEYDTIAASVGEIYDEMLSDRRRYCGDDCDEAWEAWAIDQARGIATNYAIAAAEYAESAAEAAAAAGGCGRAAVVALRRGDIATAMDELHRASSMESEYGDDPVWSVPRKWLEAKY